MQYFTTSLSLCVCCIYYFVYILRYKGGILFLQFYLVLFFFSDVVVVLCAIALGIGPLLPPTREGGDHSHTDIDRTC